MEWSGVKGERREGNDRQEKKAGGNKTARGRRKREASEEVNN